MNMVGPKSLGSLAVAILAVLMPLSADVNILFAHATSTSPLQVGFYARSCPTAESLIQNATQAKWNVNRTITTGLLRISFHDCFAQVIHAAASTRASIREKTQKSALHNSNYVAEDACPCIVSSADIISLATRDAVVTVNFLFNR
ncbi:unnamed protein product [Sphagnum troendelagicum]|uniref:Plant heme peroxidase family profile domain-containing protein n=1 Tax=Sphagnum jensenii TaxID=128206 RepID=A0ABP0WW83_9BRYO